VAVTWGGGGIFGGGGSTAPGGSTGQVQFNSGGAFAGDAGLTYDAGTDMLTVAGPTWAQALVTTGSGAQYGTVLQSAAASPYGGVLGGLTLGSGNVINWDATTNAVGGTPDSGLRRVSPGLVGVTSGGSNLGSLQAGNVTAVALGTPDAPVVTANGTNDAAANYSYKVVATLNDGTHTAAGAGTVFAGNTTLNGSNFNHLTVTPVANAASYDWYRYASTGTPASVGLIVTTAVPYTNDTGQAGDGTTAPTTNTTGRILVGDGSAAAPSVAFASEPNTGFSLPATNALGVNVGGFSYYSFQGDGVHIGQGTGFAFSTGAPAVVTATTFLRPAAAATLQLGAAPNASPVANTLLIGESGAGTNIAGANGVISSGIGTGSGAGSTLEFKTPAAHGSDAVAQTPTTRLTLGPNGIVLPDNGLGTITPGQIEYKGHTLYATTYLVRRSVVLAQEIPIAAVSVGPSSTAETTIYTIPMAANYLTAGKKIDVRLNGVITQRNNASSFATIRVKYAGATVLSVTTPASTAMTAQPFEVDIRTVCRAIGSGTTGKLISFGKFNVNGDLVAPKLVMGALTNIDTTVGNTFTVTVQWNESNAATGPFTMEMGETLCVDANT